ncbi:16S rRNA (uracil1498-N3)-methyltransferase [Spiroplasma chinense]|uniref:Ribosomal RNA small subunit methyltransferase E n=1 Tax=Spiroplasma chinense TaxID=216932 RepID=A0A5B9Y444_9MOLU|nr:RsmE family RNA methyltransferase [Spiroplasma chinense]QEH61730.1 16S rRNA (uracil1498-N3)-methyltransferase [Spiroplasma chinense]
MHSFFVSRKNDNTFLIEESDFHHIKNVIKLNVGEQIYCIFDQEKYLCEIKDFFDNECLAEIIEIVKEDIKNITIDLYVGIIREQKWDFVLQKATELGVTNIYPVQFSRNVVKIEEKKESNKIERWTSICKDAAKQSKRNSIPNIKPIIRNVSKIDSNSQINLVAWEEVKEEPLKALLEAEFNSISIVIGPEGGIDSKEVDILLKKGFKKVGLGNNILRAETASLYLISAIKYQKDI